MNADSFRNEMNSSMSIPFPKLMSAASPFGQQGFPPPPSMMNGECDPQTMYAKLNATNRLPPHFDHKSFPVPVMTDSGIIMCDDSLFRNAPTFAGEFIKK